MEVIAVSVDDAAKALSIGKTKLYAELKYGNLKAIKLGKRTLILQKDLDQYIANLSEQNSYG